MRPAPFEVGVLLMRLSKRNMSGITNGSVYKVVKHQASATRGFSCIINDNGGLFKISYVTADRWKVIELDNNEQALHLLKE